MRNGVRLIIIVAPNGCTTKEKSPGKRLPNEPHWPSLVRGCPRVVSSCATRLSLVYTDPLGDKFSAPANGTNLQVSREASANFVDAIGGGNDEEIADLVGCNDSSTLDDGETLACLTRSKP